MIFLDESETRSNTTMPEIPSAQVVPWLEEMTGADLMVSPLDAPAVSEALIKTHLQQGAQLVQVKRGHDLVSSLGDRLNMSLAKMHSIGAKQPQCVLLWTGIMTCTAQGQATLNKQNTGMTYMAIQAGIEGWNDRGGVSTNLPRNSLIPDWCNMRVKRLKKYKENAHVIAWPPVPTLYEEAELQIIQPVKDARKTLVTLPNLGEERVNTLWAEFDGRAADIIIYLTMPLSKDTRIKGIGQGTIDKIREYLNIDPVYTLGYDLCDELVKNIQEKNRK